MQHEEFVYTIYISTSADDLWRALTEGEFTKEYWGARSVSSDWQIGSDVRFDRADGKYDGLRATVIEADHPRRLVMDWRHEPTPGADRTPATRVTFDIEPAGPEDVKLTLTHATHEEGSRLDAMVKQGWPAILSSLKSQQERGRALLVTKLWARQEA